MGEWLAEISLFALVLTFGAYQIGLWCHKKWPYPIVNPLLIAVILVCGVLLGIGFPVESYQEGMRGISWLLTPATVCLAVPMYEQMKLLKRRLPEILAGVVAGTLTSLLVVAGLCHLFCLPKEVAVSFLPKSITTAMGIVLSGQNGGIEALTTAVIVMTGILGSLIGPLLCRVFRLGDPVSQGAAFGTASHVIGTTRANQMGSLTGAVSSLSLAVAGIVTALLFPLAMKLL